jgi:hypothetical protein
METIVKKPSPAPSGSLPKSLPYEKSFGGSLIVHGLTYPISLLARRTLGQNLAIDSLYCILY